jgi:uncharacterized protein (TIGR00369 family)
MADIRSRTVTWADPLAALPQSASLSGLEYLQRLIDGRIPPPPMAATLNFTLAEIGEGRAVFRGEAGEYLYNPIGVVHGGFAMTLLDSALGCAVHSTLGASEGYTTLETKVNFVRPITLATGAVRCEAAIVHRGRQTATAEGRLVEDATGKLLAHGMTTCLVIARGR